jgi:hypothetical protein
VFAVLVFRVGMVRVLMSACADVAGLAFAGLALLGFAVPALALLGLTFRWALRC